MKKRFKSFVILVAVAGLASCGPEASSEVTSATSASDDTSVVTSDTTSEVTSEYVGKTNEDFTTAKTTYMDEFDKEHNLNMNTIYDNAGQPHNMNLNDPENPSHVMIVPFGFDDPATDPTETAENRDRIETAFLGTDEEIAEVGGCYSVQSFYNQSSYGKSAFNGTVLPNWVEYPGSADDFEASCGEAAGAYASNYVRKWYIAEYSKDSNHGSLGADAEPLSYYDSNDDGYIDLMWTVYSKPYESGGLGNNWWAYVTMTGNQPGTVGAPNVATLGWASISFLDEGYSGYDTHTFTHETGHTFGLEDYYDYNNLWSCMGGVDYMDHNLGDHNAFSKFSLGWVNPLVVDDSAIITINSFTDSGDCFLLPSPNYNGTAFDEYFLCELDGPTGLTENDYKYGYSTTTGFKTPGLRVLHVDARVTRGDHDTYLADNPEDGNTFRIGNSKGGRSGIRTDGDYFLRDDGTKGYMSLLSMVESSVNEEKNTTTTNNYNASSDSLFQKNARLNFGKRYSWAETYMPSGTNLWNKAQKTTGWDTKDLDLKTVDTDYEATIDFSLKVLSITGDSDSGYQAQVQVTYDKQ